MLLTRLHAFTCDASLRWGAKHTYRFCLLQQAEIDMYILYSKCMYMQISPCLDVLVEYLYFGLVPPI